MTAARTTLKPLSRDTLTQQATDTLRRFILDTGVKPEEQLPSERDLSASLSVSRNIVREALSVLVAEGLIEKRAGRGIFVRQYDPARLSQQIANSTGHEEHDLAELGQARAAVELGAAGLMAENITEGQLNQLESINQALAENLRKGRGAIKEDIDFHKVLLQSTHNSVLIELIALLVEHFRLTVLNRPAAILHNPERIVSEHQRIIDALRTRDPAEVRSALLAHPLSVKDLSKDQG